MLQKLVFLAQRRARLIKVALFGGLLALVPSLALAAGGEAVTLKFSDSDKLFLYISLALGLIAVVFAVTIRNWVLAQTPGNDKMQEVGQAIREGALAYLRRQMGTMIYFIGGLAVILLFVFAAKNNFTPSGYKISAAMAVCFIGGVAASYVAGFAGMMMAVAANMRSAAAALTSPKKSLEVAFKAGAVAGLLTVGMGLIGATLIFLIAGGDAMQLLIGFGFGGSLAALFMRVGGGIYTKAADVGADLVGKVEAGIPEDDARNPATIADNVGDNVGDCAGMAADVFESYEVTLVAAIVLGAATAAIFDQQTWMRLVIFALMARGVGILASIAGILMVKGSDDVDTDALKPIQGGFRWSAVFAGIGTLVLAYLMMGGNIMGKARLSADVETTKLVSLDEYRERSFEAVRKVRDELAKKDKKQNWEVTPADIQKELTERDKKLSDELRPKVAERKKKPASAVTEKEIQDTPEFSQRGFNMSEPGMLGMIQAAVSSNMEEMPKVKKLEGFTPLDFTDKTNPVLNYAVMKQPSSPGEQPKYVSVEEYFKDNPLKSYHIHFKITPPAQPGQPAQPTREDEAWLGPMQKADYDKVLESAKGVGAQVDLLSEEPAAIYFNKEGELAVALSDKINNPTRNVAGANLPGFFKMDPASVQAMSDAQRTDPTKPLPPSQQFKMGVAEHQMVAWWLFFVAIGFGILMAFAIEMLTDYYVSLHGRPVKEVAGVATTGPAPMIIQGFALAAESSVFSVFAIVIALLVPLYLFSPVLFGSPILSFYGIALVGLGLLTTTGYILAMDTFGPISDNAQGVFEMSGAGHDNPRGAKAVQRLDAAGNTTKALTKGFAIATAVVAAVALFHSYIEEAHLTTTGLKLEVPEIFLGLLIGGAAPFLFSAFAINAVGRAAFDLINEVRRQFKADPGIMEGTSKPNYGNCVAIVTEAAQRELLGPGILAIALPMAVAFGFSIGKEPVMIGEHLYNLNGAQALGGFLAGAILSGQLLAVLLANSGGIWDNAKKLIEDGMHGGKGTEAHKAGVVCDTVGDPFKDTAGPALNPLIKVMNLIALLLASVVIQPIADIWLILITAVCLAALIFSIWWSKRSSMSTALVAAAGSEPPPAMTQGSKKRLTVEQPESEPEGGQSS